MTAPGIRWYSSSVVTFTMSGTYAKPTNLTWIQVYIQGAGGGGGSQGGGGGGATVVTEKLHSMLIGESVPVTVGVSSAGQDGGDSGFGDVIAPGGKAGAPNGSGAGGVSPWRGGHGSTGAGESISHQPISNIAGGGGGGAGGGTSGGDYRDGSSPLWPGWFQAGRGGGSNQDGETPAGGGGRGSTAGGNGLVTIIETLVHEEDA